MKTVIITGGTKGIGADIAQTFLNSDYYVIVGARNIPKEKINKRSNIEFLKINVCEQNDHKKLVQIALERTGSIDCYINFAGFSKWVPIEKIEDIHLRELIEVNMFGTIWGCKIAAENLSKGGTIINISSLAGKRGSANNSVYCATKFGVNGVTQALAKELGPRGIRVNAVCPVYVETPGLLEALGNKDSPTKGKNVSSYLDEFAQNQSALKRLPKGNEVADFCLYLASEKASAVTGQCINVDCGVLPQ